MIDYKLALRARTQLQKAFRLFFETQQYEEIQTPILVPCPGTELHLNYFKSEWMNYDHSKLDLWLRSSPELHMKQALATLDFHAIFQFATCFRNFGECSHWHHPEFMMVEWYKTGITFDAYIQETQDLLSYSLAYMKDRLGKDIAGLTLGPIQKLTVKEAFLEFAGVVLMDQDPDLAKKVQGKGSQFISIQAKDDFETAYFKILIDIIEPALTKMQSCILYDYPPSQAALARVENGVAKRFEFYIQGVELCNGFDELVNPDENRKRIAETQKMRKHLGKEVTREDEDFYAAMDIGLAPCCGNALGFDRWLALILNQTRLHSLLPFRKIFS